MNFSPADIGYFLEIARQGHMGRAAATFGITQPAITKSVRRLEDAVGVPLFERGAHGARLTPQGLLFLETARRFDLQHSELVRSAADLRAQSVGLLRLGVTNPASDSEVVNAMALLTRRRPGLRIKLTLGKSDVLNQAVENGELDMAVVPAYPGVTFSCDQIPVNEDRIRVAARNGHPLLSASALSLQDLGPYGWVMPSRDSAARQVINTIFERAGLPPPHVNVEVEYTSEAVLGLVTGTDLITLAPVSSLRGWAGRVVPLPLEMLVIPRTLVLITRVNAVWSSLMTDFRDALLPAP